MKPVSLLCLALCLVLSATAAFARGGMGSHMSMGDASMGGALGTSAAAPGTNSLGTALPSSGSGGRATKGPLLGTNPAIDQEDARLEKMLQGSICRVVDPRRCWPQPRGLARSRTPSGRRSGRWIPELTNNLAHLTVPTARRPPI